MSEREQGGEASEAARMGAIAAAFGAGPPIRHLSGGMGQSWRVSSSHGPCVIKPAPHPDEARWLGEVFAQLPGIREARIPEAVIDGSGAWIFDDHVCWSWLEGAEEAGRYPEKLAASRAFHDATRILEKPDFIDRRNDPWALADRVAWGERPADYDSGTMQVLEPVLSEIRQTPLPPEAAPQLIHGDLSGNFVFAPGLAPGIIDITPYWRPVGFAEAVIWVDSIWFEARADARDFHRPGMRAFVLRALARRMAEQPEQVAAGIRDRNDAAETLARLSEAVERIVKAFPSE